MKPTLDRPFADGRLALQVSCAASAFPFVDFAQALADEYQGKIVERLGAPGGDDVYWDIRLGSHVLTLYSQHFLGVYLCALRRSSDDRS
jgi:hypothetical protein